MAADDVISAVFDILPSTGPSVLDDKQTTPCRPISDDTLGRIITCVLDYFEFLLPAFLTFLFKRRLAKAFPERFALPLCRLRPRAAGAAAAPMRPARPPRRRSDSAASFFGTAVRRRLHDRFRPGAVRLQPTGECRAMGGVKGTPACAASGRSYRRRTAPAMAVAVVAILGQDRGQCLDQFRVQR